ncbi:unnamed protein product [Effrenium voratum]|nr:unnamed protein product [Effrenium voratum]
MPQEGQKYPYHVGLVGDIGQTPVSNSSMHLLSQLNPELVLMTGDLSYADGFFPRWDSFGIMFEPLGARVPSMTCPGNHEYATAEAFKSFAVRYPMPYEQSGSHDATYWSRDIGPMHVVSLNSYGSTHSGSFQYKWLERDLKNFDRTKTPWLVVVMHAPWYNSNLGHLGEAEVMREDLEDMLFEHGVNLVVAGHVHSYERTWPVYKNATHPCGPVFINIGDGGNYEGPYSHWLPGENSSEPAWSAFRQGAFGIGHLEFSNASHVKFAWKRNACFDHGEVDFDPANCSSSKDNSRDAVRPEDESWIVRHIVPEPEVTMSQLGVADDNFVAFGGSASDVSKAFELVRGVATLSVFFPNGPGDVSLFASVWKSRCRLGCRGALRALQGLQLCGAELAEALAPLAQQLDASEEPLEPPPEKPRHGHLCALLRPGGGRLRNWCADELQRAMSLGGLPEPEITFEELEPFLVAFRTEETRKEAAFRCLDLLGAPTLGRHAQSSRYRQAFMEAFAPLSLHMRLEDDDQNRVPPHGTLPALPHREEAQLILTWLGNVTRSHFGNGAVPAPRSREVLVRSLRKLSADPMEAVDPLELDSSPSTACVRILAHSVGFGGPVLFRSWTPRLFRAEPTVEAMLSFLRRSRPELHGQHPLGCIRTRMQLTADKDIQVQVHYPGDTAAPPISDKGPLFRTEVLELLAEQIKLPRWAVRSLYKGDTQLDPPVAPAAAEAAEAEAASAAWPVAVFSSGLLGSCEMYTQFCRDVASLGWVVIALEHEDGSGVFALDTEGRKIPYVEMPKGMDIAGFRQPFLEVRTEELFKVTRALQAKNFSGQLGQVLQRADTERMILIGHSFGSASAWRFLRTAAQRNEAPGFQSALLMDLWPEVLLEADFEFTPQVPFALTVSGEWVGYPKIMAGNKRAAAHEKCQGCFHIKGTCHQWISETQMAMPNWLLRRMGAMGPGDWPSAYAATMVVVAAFLANHPVPSHDLVEPLANL